jgi:hypothetical protein
MELKDRKRIVNGRFPKFDPGKPITDNTTSE